MSPIARCPSGVGEPVELRRPFIFKRKIAPPGFKKKIDSGVTNGSKGVLQVLRKQMRHVDQV